MSLLHQAQRFLRSRRKAWLRVLILACLAAGVVWLFGEDSTTVAVNYVLF